MAIDLSGKSEREQRRGTYRLAFFVLRVASLDSFCDSALPGRNDGVARGIVCRLVFIFVTPPSYGHLPYILHGKTPRNAAGHGRGVLKYF